MTRKQLLELYKESPVPVYEVNTKTWWGWYNKRLGRNRTVISLGTCFFLRDEIAKKLGKPAKFIILEKSLPNYVKASIVLHEIGHVKDPNVGLPGFDRSKQEYTAEKYATKEMVRRKLFRSARVSIDKVNRWTQYPNYYATAAKILLNDEEYQKCVRAVEKHYHEKQK